MVQQQNGFSPKLKRALITQSTMDLNQECRGLNVFFMNNAYYTLCAQHITALPPSPGRETRQGVSVRPEQPSGTVWACSFIWQPLEAETSLPQSSSTVCRG